MRCQLERINGVSVILPTFSGHPKGGILTLIGVFHETQTI